MKFFICEHCGNLVEMINSSGVPMICCGEPMKEIKANTVDASKEKHVPVLSIEGNTVTVSIGSVAHPMTKEHFIEWVCLETEKGTQRKHLKPEDRPEAVFTLNDDKVKAVYIYCNLHGLWSAEAK